MNSLVDSLGPYEQDNSGKAHILFIDGEHCFGRDSCGRHRIWSVSDGVDFNEGFSGHPRLLRKWTEPPEPLAGYRVMPRDYVAKFSDMAFGQRFRTWMLVTEEWLGMSVSEMEELWPEYAPHYIASPIPAPFRISTHGPGCYETRDGRQEPIEGKSFTGNVEHPWRGGDSGGNHNLYRDDGRRCSGRESPDDIVRYIGPLPAPETWTPRELQWTEVAEGRMNSTFICVACEKNGCGWSYRNHVLEQKWTCGEREEWRPVEVSNA